MLETGRETAAWEKCIKEAKVRLGLQCQLRRRNALCIYFVVLTFVYLLTVGVEINVVLDETQGHTHGRTSLDERSARRRDLYVTMHNTHKRWTPMTLAGFKPAILGSERSQTHAQTARSPGSASFTATKYTGVCLDGWTIQSRCAQDETILQLHMARLLLRCIVTVFEAEVTRQMKFRRGLLVNSILKQQSFCVHESCCITIPYDVRLRTSIVDTLVGQHPNSCAYSLHLIFPLFPFESAHPLVLTRLSQSHHLNSCSFSLDTKSKKALKRDFLSVL